MSFTKTDMSQLNLLHTLKLYLSSITITLSSYLRLVSQWSPTLKFFDQNCMDSYSAYVLHVPPITVKTLWVTGL